MKTKKKSTSPWPHDFRRTFPSCWGCCMPPSSPRPVTVPASAATLTSVAVMFVVLLMLVALIAVLVFVLTLSSA